MKLWRFLVLLAGALALFAFGLVAFNYLVMPRLIHHNTVVLMPDLRGRTLAAAHEEAARRELILRETRQRPHPTLPAGTVLDQDPAPASPLRRGRTVEVVTSSGPPVGGVPELVGLSRRQAELTLQRERLRLGRVGRIRLPGVTVPVVSHQYPPAGTELQLDSPVDLIVGEPALPTAYRMPDLRGLPLHLARREIAAAGCVAGSVSYRRGEDVPPNTVVAQDPAAGSRILKGARVELVAASR